MKRNSITLLAVVIVLAMPLWFVGLAGAGRSTSPSRQGGAPTVVNYQGQVMLGGWSFDGTGYFKFAVVDGAGTTTYWSNDGTSTGGVAPTNGVSLTVSSGLFSVLLGDTSLNNMTQSLDASVFAGTERYLRVWFSTDDSTYEQLSPDQRIAAVPYALQAEEAANGVPVGALVLGETDDETAMIAAGFAYTGLKVDVDGWLVKTPMPTARTAVMVAVVDGIVYAVGGSSDSSSCTTLNQAYDPATDSWSTKAPMPTARCGAAIAVVDGLIYVIGGQAGATTFQVNEAYDPVSDSWTTKASMPTARAYTKAVVVNGLIYVIGGLDASVSLDANEVYDPVADSWSTKAAMPTPRFALAADQVDGVIYVIGGTQNVVPAPGDYLDVNEAYDPATNSWTTKTAMPTARTQLSAAAVDGLIYVIGGDRPPYNFQDINEVYDPAADSWDTRAAMPTARTVSGVGVANGVIYIIGGNKSPGSTLASENETYVPALHVYRRGSGQQRGGE